MNKRIKLKKGLLHKRCDDKCVNYRIIREKKLLTNNICQSCKFRNGREIQQILKSNRYAERYIDCKEFVELAYLYLKNK